MFLILARRYSSTVVVTSQATTQTNMLLDTFRFYRLGSERPYGFLLPRFHQIAPPLVLPPPPCTATPPLHINVATTCTSYLQNTNKIPYSAVHDAKMYVIYNITVHNKDDEIVPAQVLYH